jgi:hypothetical protein
MRTTGEITRKAPLLAKGRLYEYKRREHADEAERTGVVFS